MPAPTIAHVVREYLPPSQTFVHSQLVHQRDFRPVVLAGKVLPDHQFPFSPIEELITDEPLHRRFARRVHAHADGWPTTFADRAAQAIRAHEAVAVHAHFGPAGWQALEPAQRSGVPLITTFYGHDLSAAQRDPAWGPRYEELFAEGRLFLCEGPAMARTLESIGCPPDRIGILRIGFALDAFPFVIHRGAASQPFTIVQVGRMVEKKGFDLGLRAFAAARPELGHCRLRLIGDGPLLGELEQLAGELGVARQVDFLGALPYAEYAKVMREAHLGLVPSRVASDGDTEGGAPTVLLEMQSSGMAVVATRHADIPFVVARPDELVEEEDVPGLATAILATARRSPAERTARARVGRAFVEERHAGERVAAVLSDHYRAALPTRTEALVLATAANRRSTRRDYARRVPGLRQPRHR